MSQPADDQGPWPGTRTREGRSEPQSGGGRAWTGDPEPEPEGQGRRAHGQKGPVPVGLDR
ncbi:hypothetical protein GCM10010317_073830 [Streptomyces mirabilis]|nr:hypothetical protein GCM10010317_073830 [Streptomyces mirabilis]